MKFWGHVFRSFGEAEMICPQCGYVLSSGQTEAEAKAWMLYHDSKRVRCGGEWHKLLPLPSTQVQASDGIDGGQS